MLPEFFIEGRMLIVAFEGWNDAGEAASVALDHICTSLSAESVAELDAEDYFDYQFNRPVAKLNDQGDQQITWPTISFYSSDPRLTGKSEKDTADSTAKILLLKGTEPSRSWRSFAGELLDLCHEHDVSCIIFIGALLADAPHTRPISLFTTSENDEIRDKLELSRSNYEGPVGILSILAVEAERRGIPTLSIWAQVPHYMHNPPSPKASLALVQKLEDLFGFETEKKQLVKAANKWEANMSMLASDDEDLVSYISELERIRDAQDAAAATQASGEEIAKEFERYLKLRDPKNNHDGNTTE